MDDEHELDHVLIGYSDLAPSPIRTKMKRATCQSKTLKRTSRPTLTPTPRGSRFASPKSVNLDACMTEGREVVVIGAGVGGLATSVRMAARTSRDRT